MKKPGRNENPAYDQGRQRIREDNLQEAKNLQDRQHTQKLEIHKKQSILIILSIIIPIIVCYSIDSIINFLNHQ
jgi:uncharacterized membrane protein YvbJ